MSELKNIPVPVPSSVKSSALVGLEEVSQQTSFSVMKLSSSSVTFPPLIYWTIYIFPDSFGKVYYNLLRINHKLSLINQLRTININLFSIIYLPMTITNHFLSSTILPVTITYHFLSSTILPMTIAYHYLSSTFL